MQIAPAGDRALLLTIPAASAARLRTVAERARSIDGVVAAIVGHESVYVIGTSDADALRDAANVLDAETKPGKLHRIDVSFDREYALDLDEFLAHARVTREEFLRRIPTIALSVRYLGFRGGFAYLEGWPPEWAMPRRATSRNLVPGGSFGIAGAMAGFYPLDSPGGWNILGRTDAELEYRFRPGDEIRLGVATALRSRVGGLTPAAPRGVAIGEVLSPGQLTTIVGTRDWSRLEFGEAPGGPFDVEAAAIANEAVGNPPNAPLLECVLVGPSLKTDRRVAFCDADLTVRETKDVGRIHGMRGYLAIEGGLDNVGAVLKKGDSLSGAAGFSPTAVVKRRDSLSGAAGFTPPAVVKRRDSLSGAAGFSPPAGGLKAAATRIDRREIHIKKGPHDAPPLPVE